MSARGARLASIRAVIFVLVGLALAACGPSPTAPSLEPGPSAVAERDGIRVSLTLDRAALPAGDRTLAVVTVENTTPERRLYQGGGCDFLASIDIATAAEVQPAVGQRWPGTAGRFKDLLNPTPGPSSQGMFVDERFVEPTRIVCTADLGVNELSAGQRLEMRAIWNGEVNGVVAAPGPARVTASFPYLGQPAGPDPFANAPQPIQAVIDVDVVDTGVRLLSPGQAIDAALGNAEFGAWLARAGAIERWRGVELEGSGHTLAVILIVGDQEGRASVDRVSGAVTFAQKLRP
jgi:hypothetical protein